MKKILSILLVLTLLSSLAACGSKKDEVEDAGSGVITEETLSPEENNQEEGEDLQASQTSAPKPSKNPATTQAPTQAPTQSPTQVPTQAPTQKPAENKTMGQTLLGEFKSQMAKNPNATTAQLASSLISHPIIKFSGGTNDVVPGYLAGFDAEIHDFKAATMFAPMIGSIAFVGYVFELEDASLASSFISNLKKNANPRWNICVEAEETQIASSGNKVFFLMCPKNMESPDAE